MVYSSVSGIRFPSAILLHNSSPSSFSGDRRSATLSLFLKKEPLFRKIISVYLMIVFDFVATTVSQALLYFAAGLISFLI